MSTEESALITTQQLRNNLDQPVSKGKDIKMKIKRGKKISTSPYPPTKKLQKQRPEPKSKTISKPKQTKKKKPTLKKSKKAVDGSSFLITECQGQTANDDGNRYIYKNLLNIL